MLSHTSDKELGLYSYTEIAAGETSFPEEQLRPVEEVTAWARDHLSNSYSGLGRRGAVCPFVKKTLEKFDSFYLTCLGPPAPTTDRIIQVIEECRDWFEALPPVSESQRFFKTIVIVLPTVSSDEAGGQYIDMLHQKMKPSFVRRSMMLGQFYPTCAVPGLHNLEFRPFQSPVPMFAIRYMQITDLGFLVHEDSFVREYCRTFGIRDARELAKLVRSYRIEQLPLFWDEYVEKIFDEPVHTTDAPDDPNRRDVELTHSTEQSAQV